MSAEMTAPGPGGADRRGDGKALREQDSSAQRRGRGKAQKTIELIEAAYLTLERVYGARR